MSNKSIIVSAILSILIVVLYFINEVNDPKIVEATNVYEVYLDGNELGKIANKEELYDLINKEQKSIKETYNVDYVYPPSGLNIIKTQSYDNDFKSVNDIYKHIEDLNDFTVKGYIISIKGNEKEEINIKVLDKEIFNTAINNFILSFITKDQLNKYNENLRTTNEIGSVISSMNFLESITIKEGYISVDDNIFTDSDTLSQYLLFGPDAKMDSYTVQTGDSIASISEANQISTQEFLVANPKYSSETALLTVGSNVNVTLINPVLNLSYNIYEISENETPFSTETIVDNTKPSNYSEITKSGVNGLTLVHATYNVVNGVSSNEAKISKQEVIREMVKQEVTVGRKIVSRPSNVSGNYVNVSGWGYPTNYPFMLTSPFGWRGKKLHNGVDISGTGFRSPIYAVADGVVVESTFRNMDGNFIIVQHDNNIYTQYAHLYRSLVREGQTVNKGQQIGEMGDSGLAFGVHLHFGVSVGWPFHGSYAFQNPLNYIRLR